MQHFEFRVQGLGPSPAVFFVVTRDADSARSIAERMLSECAGRAHIDVWQAKLYLFTVGHPAPIQDERSMPQGFATVFSA
jgi:hypothetical protein